MSQFENFTASTLYCDKCKATMPVRERLLLVLPDKELYDYLCTGCASSVGSREHPLVGIVTQPDKPAGRDQKITPPPIKAATQQCVGYATSGCELELPVLQPARIKMPEAIEAIRRLNPDVIVVMAYGQILPREVLKIPKIACLNLHASILPRWRGAAPIQAAIAAGDRETGVTVIYMDDGDPGFAI